jgi:hypothetical protein
LKILLDANIQKTIFTPQYKSALDSVKNLDKIIDDFELFRRDPFFIVNKKISDLKSETDIIRDQFKLSIDAKANAILKELIEYEQNCKSKLESSGKAKKLDKIAAEIERIRNDMDKWQTQLDSFESNEKGWQMIKEKGDKYKTELEKEMNEYENEFLLNKIKDYQLKVAGFCKFQLESDRM